MTLFLNFITAVAFMWGGLCCLGVLLSLVPPIRPKDAANAGTYILAGVLPWAWLIARYLL